MIAVVAAVAPKLELVTRHVDEVDNDLAGVIRRLDSIERIVTSTNEDVALLKQVSEDMRTEFEKIGPLLAMILEKVSASTV
jgi:hypothetical protein